MHPPPANIHQPPATSRQWFVIIEAAPVSIIITRGAAPAIMHAAANMDAAANHY